MKSINYIRNRLRELFKTYLKKDFDLTKELMEESGYKESEVKGKGISKNFSSLFFTFLCEELYKICLENKKIVKNLYLIKHVPKTEYIYIGKQGSGETQTYKEIFPGLILKKGTFFKIVDKLDLTKTKESYIYYLITNEEELIESKNYLLNYLTESQIKKYKKMNIDELLTEEFKNKLKKKPRLINIE